MRSPLALLALAALVLAGCQPPTLDTSTSVVHLVLASDARTVAPTTPATAADVDHYEAIWVSGQTTKRWSNLSARSTQSLAPGVWTLTVNGYGAAASDPLLSATQVVTLVAGPNTVSVTLSPARSSTGTFRVDFDWAEGGDSLLFELQPWSQPDVATGLTAPVASVLLTSASPAAGSLADLPSGSPYLTQGSYTYDAAREKASFSGRLASGNYLLKVTPRLSSTSLGVYSQILQVVDGKLSSSRFNPVRGVFYDANGGTGSMNPQKDLIGSRIYAQVNAFTRPLVYTGWNTRADGTGTSVAPNDQLILGSDDVTLYAQWTDTLTLNLESMTTGPVSGQDGWVASDYVGSPVEALPSDGSLAPPLDTALVPNTSMVLASTNMTGSYYAAANRPTGFPIDLSDPKSTYVLTFDMVYAWWGTVFGLGADLDHNGTIEKGSTGEQALTLTAVGYPIYGNGQSLTLGLPNGTSVQLSGDPLGTSNDNTWFRFEVTLNQDKVSVRSKNLTNSGAWVTHWSNQTMGTVAGSGLLTDPAKWDQFYVDFETGGGRVDNIVLKKVVAP